MSTIARRPRRWERSRPLFRLAVVLATVVVGRTAAGQQHWGGSGKPVAGGAEKLAIHETGEEVAVTLGADVLFDFDKADLKPAAEPDLARVAEIVRRYPRGGVLIEGHTDGLGGETYNLNLSRRRADAVRQWLVDHGVSAGKIRTNGWGMSKPVAPNTNPDGSDNPTGRAKNRRVEITVQKR